MTTNGSKKYVFLQMKDFNAIMIKLHGELYQNGITDDVQPYAESGPRFTKGRKSYDFRPILLPLSD